MQGIQNSSPFPKIYLTINITLALLVFLKVLDPYTISYSLNQTFSQLSLWRPFTAILYLSRISILFPFQCAFAYLACYKLSNTVYKRNFLADQVWLLIISCFALMIFSSFLGLYFYGNSFVMIMLTMWAIQHPRDIVKVLNIQIHSVYFPIIYPIVMVILGSSYKHYVAGFLIGLLYGLLKNPPFIAQNGDYLPTPMFIKTFFRSEIYQIESRRIEEVRYQQRDRYFQGQGYRLA